MALQLIHGLYVQTLVALQSNIREVSEDVLRNFDDHNKNLYFKEQSGPDEFKLGDRVEIALKHRQFLQVTESAWNELMKHEYDQVGTVIGLQMAEAPLATVFYQKSGRGWVIDAKALKKSTKSEMDAKSESFNQELKIGDFVEIDKNLPDYTIEILQSNYALPEAGVFKYRNLLGKILAFEFGGAAIVSVSKYESTVIHPGLLKKRNETFDKKKPPPMVGKKLIIDSNIQKLIQSPFWNYRHTQIIGKTPRIDKDNGNGIFQIDVSGKTYHVPSEYFTCKPSKKNRHRRDIGDKMKDARYPFEIGNILEFEMVRSERCLKLLKESGLPLELFEVIEDIRLHFQGYSGVETAAVTVDWPSPIRNISKPPVQFVLTKLMQKVSENSLKFYQTRLDERKNLKTGDRVSLFGAKYQRSLPKIMKDIFVPDHIIQVMTSNAELVAFDDDNNEAILRFDNGKLYACPSGFVNPAFNPEVVKYPNKSDEYTIYYITPFFSEIVLRFIKQVLVQSHSGKWKLEPSFKNLVSVITAITVHVDQSVDPIQVYELLHQSFLSFFENSSFVIGIKPSEENSIGIQFIDKSQVDVFIHCSGNLQENVQTSPDHRALGASTSSNHPSDPNDNQIKVKAESFQFPHSVASVSSSSSLKTPADCGSKQFKNSDKCEQAAANDYSSRLFPSESDQDKKSEVVQSNEQPHSRWYPLGSSVGTFEPQGEQPYTEARRPDNDDDETDLEQSERGSLVREPGEGPFSDLQPGEEDQENAAAENENENDSDNQEAIDENLAQDEMVERDATMSFNRRTNEVVMKGCFDENVIRRGKRSPLTRQASRIDEQVPGIIGGPNTTNNMFQNCVFQGPTYFGGDTSEQSSSVHNSRQEE